MLKMRLKKLDPRLHFPKRKIIRRLNVWWWRWLQICVLGCGILWSVGKKRQLAFSTTWGNVAAMSGIFRTVPQELPRWSRGCCGCKRLTVQGRFCEDWSSRSLALELRCALCRGSAHMCIHACTCMSVRWFRLHVVLGRVCHSEAERKERGYLKDYRSKLDRWPCHVTLTEKRPFFLQGMAQSCVTHVLPDGIWLGKTRFRQLWLGFGP